MTKAELVASIVDQTGMDREEVNLVVNTLTETIKREMIGGSEIFIRGFGSFILKKRARKKARNIKAGESLVIPEHYVPQFKPARDFSDDIKNSKKIWEKLEPNRPID